MLVRKDVGILRAIVLGCIQDLDVDGNSLGEDCRVDRERTGVGGRYCGAGLVVESSRGKVPSWAWATLLVKDMTGAGWSGKR